MPKSKDSITAAEVNALKKVVGRHAVGHGVYLQVKPSGALSWLYRYKLGTRRREIGLGSCSRVTLAEARTKGKEFKLLVEQGLDPKIHREKIKQENMLKQAWTFDECAKAYIKAKQAGWKNPKHRQQWVNTLEKYASPILGSLPVAEIDNAAVLKVVEPIWLTKNETATRVRSRIENVLSWATVRGYRSGPNPAIWRGNLSVQLPKPSDVTEVTHHQALPYKEAPIFIRELLSKDSISAKALIFTIATACRTGEVIGANWSEIDIVEKVWTIPKERMKAGKLHRVPLNEMALDVLESLPRFDGWLFPSPQRGKHISNMAMLKVIKGMRENLTVHGFRSTFRDWCAEDTNHEWNIAEVALAHHVKTETEAAYQRGDLLEKRRELMQDWSHYLTSDAASVVAINE